MKATTLGLKKTKATRDPGKHTLPWENDEQEEKAKQKQNYHGFPLDFLDNRKHGKQTHVKREHIINECQEKTKQKGRNGRASEKQKYPCLPSFRFPKPTENMANKHMPKKKRRSSKDEHAWKRMNDGSDLKFLSKQKK